MKIKKKRNNALWVAEQLGIKINIVDVVQEYKQVLLNPKHGYGMNMNPCLDCKIFMVSKAVEWIKKNHADGFDFIITGEVIGQRPMSQRRLTMPIVASESGADDILLRPLCAKNLPATKPELEGWVDREKLYDFNGRVRTPQMVLAEEYGFTDYATPAGGCCFLTDKSYSSKLIDGKIELEDYNHAASIVARYGQGRNADKVEMTFALPNAKAQSIMVQPLTTAQVLKEWHV
jgi:tRNA U34 2-thiouridine synthase MnmA/TrmU